MKIEIEVSEDCEGTSYPWWFICDPRQNMRLDLAVAAINIVGPFFSRAEAENELAATSYNYSHRAQVWCGSGYRSRSYKEAINAANKESVIR